MATIGEHVAVFIANGNYTDHDHAVAQDWLMATKCGNFDIRLLAAPRESLGKNDSKRRDGIRKETLGFIHRHFDDRPDVVRSLDMLFAEFGLSNEQDRRREFFQFESIYNQDEVSVLLLKHLQPTNGRSRYTQENIAEYFLTSTRTINDHIRVLKPAVDRELRAKVFGQDVQMDTARGTNVPESTTHPLFLPLNMVDLYTLVDTLVQHVDDEVEGRIVQSILERILGQTTDYARERLGRIAGFDEALSDISSQGDQRGPGEAVMFSEKERIRATVRYMKNGEEKTCKGFISRNHVNRAIIDVVDDDRVLHIPYRDIVELKSSRE